MSDERRQHTRVPTDVIVRMHFSTIGEFMQSQAENISTGGMQLTTAQPLAVGDLVGLEFRLTSNYPLIEGTATVKWCRPAGAHFQVGVEFGDLDERSRRVIVEAVKHQERDATELTEDLLVSPDGPEDIVELPDDAALDVETADLEPVFDAPPAVPPAASAAAPEPWDVEEVVADDLPAAEAFEAEDAGDFGGTDWGDVTLDMPETDAAVTPPAAGAFDTDSVEAAETFDFDDVSVDVAAAPSAEPSPQPGTFDFGVDDLLEEVVEASDDFEGGTPIGAYASPAAEPAKPRVVAPGGGFKSRRVLFGVGVVGLVAVALIVWGLLPREDVIEPIASAPVAAPTPRPRAPKPVTDAAAAATTTAAAALAPAVAEPTPAAEPAPAPAPAPAPQAEPQPAPAPKAPAKAPAKVAEPEPAARTETAKPTAADGASSIVAVRVGSGSTLLTVEGDGSWEGRYRTFALTKPARIVVDLSDVALAKGVRAPAGSGDLDGVRIGRHEGKIRLVLDMRGDTPYKIVVDGALLHVRRR